MEGEQIHCVVYAVCVRCAYLSMVTRYFKSSLLITLTFERSDACARVIDLQTVHITSKNKQAKACETKHHLNHRLIFFFQLFYLSSFIRFSRISLSLSLPLPTKYTQTILHAPCYVFMRCSLSSVSQQQPICNRNEAKRILILCIGWAHV